MNVYKNTFNCHRVKASSSCSEIAEWDDRSHRKHSKPWFGGVWRKGASRKLPKAGFLLFGMHVDHEDQPRDMNMAIQGAGCSTNALVELGGLCLMIRLLDVHMYPLLLVSGVCYRTHPPE